MSTSWSLPSLNYKNKVTYLKTRHLKCINRIFTSICIALQFSLCVCVPWVISVSAKNSNKFRAGTELRLFVQQCLPFVWVNSLKASPSYTKMPVPMWLTDFRTNGMDGGQKPCMQLEIMAVDHERKSSNALRTTCGRRWHTALGSSHGNSLQKGCTGLYTNVSAV
jgi:hypothetical protein